jgi:riboflavin synthase
MFTGIITNLATVEALDSNNKKDALIKISTLKSGITRKLEIGCSIAISGICLTLIEKKISGKKIIFSFQASKETCQKTNLQNWEVGDLVNLEFAMRVGDELGGHMVLGHVDGLAKITAIKKIKDSHQFILSTENKLMKFIAGKGSVTLDGVSLTVNEVNKNSFSINIIQHTWQNTVFKNAAIGDFVNLEIDAIARYAYKLFKK